MSKIRLMVEVGVPEPDNNPDKKQAALPLSIEDRVRDALDCIDSGYKSDVEWTMINRLYKDLCDMKKKSPRVINLLNMIEPVIAKFGYHGVSAK